MDRQKANAKHIFFTIAKYSCTLNCRIYCELFIVLNKYIYKLYNDCAGKFTLMLILFNYKKQFEHLKTSR